MHWNWHHMNWSNIDSCCILSSDSCWMGSKISLVWKSRLKYNCTCIDFKRYCIPVRISKFHLQTTFNYSAVITILNNKYWHYEEATQSAMWDFILKSYTDCVWSSLSKMRRVISTSEIVEHLAHSNIYRFKSKQQILNISNTKI